jgi:hypothetical protein
MNLTTELYATQRSIWPASGRHILAQFDDESIIVYQAYKPEIGHVAARDNRFGSGWSRTRMSWFKPNFLWMMYRSGWGTKENQEVTLAIRIRRGFFERALAQAVPSSFSTDVFADESAWKKAVASSDVRLQWDPDHSPTGSALSRRAIQIGLRGVMLQEDADEATLEIHDISSFVEEQRARIHDLENLRTPSERVLTPREAEVAVRLGLSAPSST